MPERFIYIVGHPEHDYDLTVIAESPEEARDIACAYYEEDGPICDHYAVSLAPPAEGLRWVGFDSREGAEEQVAALCYDMADHHRVPVRTTHDGYFDSPPRFWEVGSFDVEWARLPSGVLCGGDQ